MKRKHLIDGFTLLEVLAVIAIMGILATLLTPAIGNLLGKARKTRMLNNLHQIALAYTTYTNDGRSLQELHRCDNVASWAAVLARRTAVNDAALYIVPEDYLIQGESRPIPQLVMVPHSDQSVPHESFKNFPLAITVITGLSPYANPSTTPLAYSRGLDPATGTWGAASGPDGGIYGTDGGFVVFLDGHVAYYESLKDALVRYDSGAPTGDIRLAVNDGARAINWQGTVWSNGN
jgi:prepilin-type N-terminal cleavage/methylation domain-containing protein